MMNIRRQTRVEARSSVDQGAIKGSDSLIFFRPIKGSDSLIFPYEEADQGI
jgi:hypothetical protein